MTFISELRCTHGIFLGEALHSALVAVGVAVRAADAGVNDVDRAGQRALFGRLFAASVAASFA